MNVASNAGKDSTVQRVKWPTEREGSELTVMVGRVARKEPMANTVPSPPTVTTRSQSSASSGNNSSMQRLLLKDEEQTGKFVTLCLIFGLAGKSRI